MHGRSWETRIKTTYVNHGKQDETGSDSLSRTIVGVDDDIYARAGENQAGGNIAGNCYMIGLDGVAGDDDKNANILEQAVYDSPPRELGEALRFLNIRNDACDKGNEPSKLF